ncbi:MAG: hypothetical protein JKX70_09340 [Phycisphaerales bacterium]|nr:hypothetical protein [Phycisphaerales bacterium]
MNRTIKYLALGTLFFPSPYLLIAQTSQEPVVAIPKPITPVWEDSRDLILLSDDSLDRIALAMQVMNISLNINNSLTPLQRFDGLSIAGHTFWPEASYDNTLTCFNGVIALNISSDATADAARMKAQAHFFKGEYQQATDAYLLCYNISKQLEVLEGSNSLADLVVTMLIQSARKAGDFDVAIQATDYVLADTTLRTEARQSSLQIGGQAALEAANNQRAELYLTTLLTDYPTYGLGFPGERVNVEMDLVRAKGFSIDNHDPEAVDAMSAIVQNVQYMGLPSWTTAVGQLAALLEKADEMPNANALRLWAIDQVDIKSNTFDSNDSNTPFMLETNRKTQLGMLQRAAKGFAKIRQYDNQADVLIRIVSEFGDINANVTASANAELERLNGLQPIP